MGPQPPSSPPSGGTTGQLAPRARARARARGPELTPSRLLALVRPLQIVSMFNAPPPPSLSDPNQKNRYLTEIVTVFTGGTAMYYFPQDLQVTIVTQW